MLAVAYTAEKKLRENCGADTVCEILRENCGADVGYGQRDPEILRG